MTTTPYATSIDVGDRVRLDLFTPTMFRIRISSLDGERFQPRYEVPFCVGKTTPWPEVPFTKRMKGVTLYVETELLQIRVQSQSGDISVWQKDGSSRIFPSQGPDRGLFRDGYTWFDSASALMEANVNSRYAHWFYSEETQLYDTFLAEDALLDRFFIYGPDYHQLFKQLNDLVGPEPLLPRKSYGFFQTQHIADKGSQTKLMEVARIMRSRGIPCDTLVLDFEWGDGCNGEGNTPWGSSLDWSPKYSTPLSPEQMVAALRKQHFNLMLIHHSAPSYPDRSTAGWTSRVYPEAVWWKAFQEKLALGVEGTWQDTRQNDITDARIFSTQEKLQNRRVTFLGCRQMFDVQGWDGWGQHIPDFQVIGSRRYPFDWTGDHDSTWKEFAWQVEAIVNRHGSMKAISYLTNDTTGADWKIQARWNQFQAFNTVARSHTMKPWDTNRDPDAWLASIAWDGAEGGSQAADTNRSTATPVSSGSAEESIRRHLQLRYRLLPYLYSLAHQNYLTGMPVCRPLLLAFNQDPLCAHDQWPRQYMFGDAFLVAPVCADIASMPIYFPAAHTWYDWWTGAMIQGGTVLDWDVSDINRLPLFVRDGALIPMQNRDTEWIDPSPVDSLTLKVYPGVSRSSSEFTLFDDDGQSLGYRNGEFGVTLLTCKTSDSGEISLTIDAEQGKYDGKPDCRNWHIEFVGVAPSAQVHIDAVPFETNRTCSGSEHLVVNVRQDGTRALMISIGIALGLTQK